jgi:hypothetical protein
MSYFEPIDTRLVDMVIDDLEDCNAHTLCDLLRAHYQLPGKLPDQVADEAYEAAKAIFFDYRMTRRSLADVAAN